MSALCLLTVCQSPAILRPIKADSPVEGQGYSQADKPPLRAVLAKARQFRAGAEGRWIAPPPAHPPLASRPDDACYRQRPPASCLRSSPRLSPGLAAVPLLLSRGTVGVPPPAGGGRGRSCLYRRQMTAVCRSSKRGGSGPAPFGEGRPARLSLRSIVPVQSPAPSRIKVS